MQRNIRLSLVVAVSDNDVIGKNNQLLWHLPNDLKFFKNTTWGMPVIMGRKTYESMGRPLKGRTNIVITRQSGWDPGVGVEVVGSIEEAIAAAGATDAQEAFVVGGGEIYSQTLPLADTIYLTRVHTSIDGDTWFSLTNTNGFELLSALDFQADDKHQFAYTFEVWKRI